MPNTRKSIRQFTLISAIAMLPLMVSACGKKTSNEKEIAALDEKLVGKGSDPVMNTAMDDRILVDPALIEGSNATNLKEADQPLNGAIPADTGYEGAIPAAADLGSGKMMRAPKPMVVAAEDCTSCGENRAVTLGGLAKDQKVHRGKGTCDAKLQYGATWAARMPAEFPVYPKGRVKEAGGVAGGPCSIRVVSFVSSAPMQDVVDYYYTRARQSGFSAEYQIRAGEHTLGGTRTKDDGAYVVTFNRAPGGGTAVDLIANNGV
jgi:hypothetical protein